MKKISFFATLLVAVALMFNACGDSSSPKGIAKSFYSAIKKGDYEKAVTVMSKNAAHTKREFSENELKSFAAKIAKRNERDKLVDFKITDEVLDESGNFSTVTIKACYESGHEEEEEMKFEKEDGKWKIKMTK